MTIFRLKKMVLLLMGGSVCRRVLLLSSLCLWLPRPAAAHVRMPGRLQKFGAVPLWSCTPSKACAAHCAGGEAAGVGLLRALRTLRTAPPCEVDSLWETPRPLWAAPDGEAERLAGELGRGGDPVVPHRGHALHAGAAARVAVPVRLLGERLCRGAWARATVDQILEPRFGTLEMTTAVYPIVRTRHLAGRAAALGDLEPAGVRGREAHVRVGEREAAALRPPHLCTAAAGGKGLVVQARMQPLIQLSI